MKKAILLLTISILVLSCSASKKASTSNESGKERIVISNEELEYEIIIINNGYDLYLRTIAKPESFYSQSYYETKNAFYVAEWNRRASSSLQYGDYYGNVIDYNLTIDYGLEVNYMLYNYFKFFEYKYRIRLR